MSRAHLVKIMTSVAERMRADFKLSGGFIHKGEKGTAREGLLHDFLERYLPGHTQSFWGAEIISASGDTSPQCDLVIADRSTLPLLDMKNYRILPIECVYGAIEVKSILNKESLLSACNNIRRVKIISEKAARTADSTRQERFNTMGMIFAFGTNSKLLTLGNHFVKWFQDVPPQERPDAIWILSKGYFGWIKPGRTVIERAVEGANLHLVDKLSPGDVLYPLALVLNSAFSGASMAPFDLTVYATEALGVSTKCWAEEPH